MRYLRHLKNKKKRNAHALALQHKQEQEKVREEMKEHARALRLAEKEKLRYEKEAQRKMKEEIRQRSREQAELSAGIIREEVSEEKERLAREKAFEKKKRKKLYRHALRIAVRNFFRGVASFRLHHLVEYGKKIRAHDAEIKRFVFIALNSTALYLLSYFCLYLIVQAATIGTSMMFNYPTTLYYDRIYFNVDVEAWYHDSVKTIFSSGPLLAFLTGTIFIILFANKKEMTGIFKLFFIWGFLHGVSMLFGAMLVGTLFESGIGHVIDWMYVMDTGKVMYSIVSLFVLAVAGFLVIKPFLLSGNTYFQNMLQGRRRTFIWAQVIVPYVLGTLLMILIRLPGFMVYETFTTFTIAISLAPVLLLYPAYNDLFFDEEKRRISLDWKYVLMLFAVIVFYRGILNFGISFPG